MILLLLVLAQTGQPVVLTDPKYPGKSAMRGMPDGGMAIRAWIESGSSGSSSGGLTDTELRATPVPVSGTLACTGPLTDTQIRATPLPVSGTLTCNAGSGTQAVSLASVPTHAVTGTFWQATQPVSGTFWQTTQPVSLAVAPTTPVTGTFWQATQPVSGTFWQTTQPVSLAVAPTTPVTGTFWQATQPVSIASMPSTPVTGTFWQATQPVSGPLTDTQLRASAVPVSLTSTTITGSVAVTMAGSNPCQSPTATLAAVAGATSGTAAVQLVALSGTTKIYICTVNITGISGTTPTFSLKYGTGSACATGGVTILGPWTTAANTVYSFNQPFVTPAGQALCYIDTGTTPIQNYAISYVQQ